MTLFAFWILSGTLVLLARALATCASIGGLIPAPCRGTAISFSNDWREFKSLVAAVFKESAAARILSTSSLLCADDTFCKTIGPAVALALASLLSIIVSRFRAPLNI